MLLFIASILSGCALAITPPGTCNCHPLQICIDQQCHSIAGARELTLNSLDGRCSKTGCKPARGINCCAGYKCVIQWGGWGACHEEPTAAPTEVPTEVPTYVPTEEPTTVEPTLVCKATCCIADSQCPTQTWGLCTPDCPNNICLLEYGYYGTCIEREPPIPSYTPTATGYGEELQSLEDMKPRKHRAVNRGFRSVRRPKDGVEDED